MDGPDGSGISHIRYAADSGQLEKRYLSRSTKKSILHPTTIFVHVCFKYFFLGSLKARRRPVQRFDLSCFFLFCLKELQREPWISILKNMPSRTEVPISHTVAFQFIGFQKTVPIPRALQLKTSEPATGSCESDCPYFYFLKRADFLFRFQYATAEGVWKTKPLLCFQIQSNSTGGHRASHRDTKTYAKPDT